MDAIPKYRWTRPTALFEGNVGELVNWLERHVNVLLPQNGAESWRVADARFRNNFELAADDQLPTSVHHIACYATRGHSEGRYIHLGVSDRSGQYVQLAAVKAFCSPEEAWSIAAICEAALTEVFWFRSQPVLVDMFERLPRQKAWHRETSLRGKISLCRLGDTGLRVEHESGSVLEELHFEGGSAAAQRDAYLADWLTVLAGQPVSVSTAVELPCLP